MIRVVAPGGLTTVQDRGRPGRAGLGIARAGALDREALTIGNRLVGNPADAAGLEILLGGFRAVTDVDRWIALSGALAAARIDGRPVDRVVAVRWPAGTELSIGVAERGVRVYLAVAGGIDTPRTLGSRCTDTMSGLGPASLRAGDVLPVGVPGAVPANDIAPWDPPAHDVAVRVSPGPRLDWFTADAWRVLTSAQWTLGADADRIGARLDGPELVRARPGELLSEGTVPGSIQVPPSGRPVILLADGPVTGGYPVIGVVVDADLDRLAQARPGAAVRLRAAG